MGQPDRSRVISSRLPSRPVGFASLRTGALVDASAWDAAYAEGRHVLRGYAVAALARTEIVLSHTTAAAHWGLPLVGVSDSAVHCIPASPHSTKTHGDVIRHDVPLPKRDIARRDGLRLTSLSRTVFDVIRMLDLRGGLAVFDAAVRQVAWSEEDHSLDRGRADAFIESVRSRIYRATGRRGIRNARIALQLVDGRAQLPGESISRLLMWELELLRPELQTRIQTDAGLAYLDFAWPQLGLFGEFDGEVKLTNPAFSRGRAKSEILLHQTARREAVEATTSWRGLHWGWSDIEDAATFRRSLREQGWPSRRMR
jgi:hypothetical protein